MSSPKLNFGCAPATGTLQGFLPGGLTQEAVASCPESSSQAVKIRRLNSYHYRFISLCNKLFGTRMKGTLLDINTFGKPSECSDFDPPNQVMKKGQTGPSLGGLDRLPAEITSSILEELDFGTLSRLRCINTAFKRVVETFPAYKDVVTHAEDALQAIHSAGIQSEITARELHHVLKSHQCVNCDTFGYILYLPTLTRVCALCIQLERFDTLLKSRVRKFYGIEEEDFQYLRVIKSQGEEYVNGFAARDLGVNRHSGETKLVRYERDQIPRVSPGWGRSFKTGENGYLYEITPWKEICTTMGYLNSSTGRVERGLCCLACQQRDESSISRDTPLWDTVYTNKGFLIHFSTCTHVKGLLGEAKERALG